MIVSNRQAAPGLVLTVMCAGMFLVLLDVTVVNVALPAIASDLDTGAAGLQWVVDGYAVAIASLLLAGGTLGDRFGHRRVVLAGLVAFGVASLGCGLAPGTGVLVAARAVQGAGAALLLPGSIAVITDAYRERAAQARALGIWAGVSSLALPAGPLLGGTLVTAAGWRLVFLVNIPVVLVVSVAVLWLVRPARWRRERRLDLPGMALAMLALGAVIFTVIDEGHHGVNVGWV
ncbi:MAG: MFS transporter, partial [Sciscionella sp.]